MNIDTCRQNENFREYYGILRTRQLQIIQIIKETSFLLGRMEAISKRAPSPAMERNVDGGLRLAFSMINSLSTILDEQMRALDVWERSFNEEQSSPPNESSATRDYYVINPN